MFDFNWRLAYEEWEQNEHTDEREAAFRAGWLGALAQIIAALQDEHLSIEAASVEHAQI